MKALIVLNHDPYDGSDVTWNALRLAGVMATQGDTVRVFLLNDSVDLVRVSVAPPEGYFDLGAMVRELLGQGVEVRACGTCIQRSGRAKGEPPFDGVPEAVMPDLAAWVRESDHVLTF